MDCIHPWHSQGRWHERKRRAVAVYLTPSGAFQPTNITFHSQNELFGDTGVVLTDCDYSLLLDGKETTHHFMVTEVYTQDENRWKLVTFSFTALVY